jgi:hypothetical protein
MVSPQGCQPRGELPVAFHAARLEWVREALEKVDPRVRRLIGAELYVLPFPRRAMLASSCDGTAIYLSPGVNRPPSRAEVHFLVFHEVGHMIHRQLLPDRDRPGWERYRRVRGIALARFGPHARHADRPHEVFAEDFRKLFGTAPARAARPLDPSSAPPLEGRRREDVRAFLEDLLSRPVVAELSSMH